MTDDSWICLALEAIDDAGLGDDPLSGLSAEEIEQLESMDLIRVDRRTDRIHEMGKEEPEVSSYTEVALTSRGKHYLDERC